MASVITSLASIIEIRLRLLQDFCIYPASFVFNRVVICAVPVYIVKEREDWLGVYKC